MGSTFTVTLPVASAVEVPAPPAAPAPENSSRLKVLLVEDHADTAATLRTLLTRKGYEVNCAASRQSALTAAQSFPFDVLVTDLGLPDGSGVDLLDKLKGAIGDRKVRGVVLSGFGMEEDVTRSRNAGFSHHLTKPVDFAVLHRCLMEIGQELEQA
jgi:CheY-like chemotaxis protein